jgi:TPR repeat protein
MFDEGVLGAFALNPEETKAIVQVARESRLGIGRTQNLQHAAKFYKRAIEKGSGSAKADAMFELSHMELNSPGEDFALLSM